MKSIAHLLLAASMSLTVPAAAQQNPQDLLNSGDYEGAIEAGRRMLRDRPGHAPARAAIMRAYLAVGRYEEVLAEAERAGPLQAVGIHAGDAARALGRIAEAGRWYRSAVAGPDSLAAELRLGELAWDRGAVDEATETFEAFIDVYNRVGGRLPAADLRAIGVALRFLGRARWELYQDAVRALTEAARAAPDDLETEVVLGDLFLAKSQGSEARASYAKVLERNSRHPAALVGMARLQQFAGERGAIETVRAALEVNPRYAPAHLFLAERHLEAEDYREASEAVAQALAVNPTMLEALSMAAAVAYLRGDSSDFIRLEREILRSNPRYSALYEKLATVSARNRLYHEAAQFAARAVRVDSLSWAGWELFGANDLRLGHIDQGRRRLERAFAGDPYDVWVKNTLDLLDTLVTYDEYRSDRFVVVTDAGESALMGQLVAELAEEAYERLATRYAFRPTTPIRVEVYPDHADFSVRTVGLVGVGALGVSFGPVVAMDSPSARDAGDFHWGSTLWHEIAHTFHLGLTRHRVPRWFTEGLAVWEERQARPGWGNRLTPAFLAAYEHGQLRNVSELNEGFVRPRHPMEVMFSYELASLVCEFIAERHSPQALVALLRAYRDDASNEEALVEVLGLSLNELDRAFDAYFRERFGDAIEALAADDDAHDEGASVEAAERAAQRNQGSFQHQLRAGRLLIDAGRYEHALPYLERARTLLPDYAGPGNAYSALARAHASLGQLGRAIWALESLIARNAGDMDAWRRLAEHRAAAGDSAGALDALEQIVYIEPFEPELHRSAAALAHDLGAWQREIRARRAVVALDPVDRAEALYRLGLAYHRAHRNDEARRVVLEALEIAPEFAEAQDLLLILYEQGR